MTYSEAVLERENFTTLIGSPLKVDDNPNAIVEEVLIIPLELDSMEKIDLFWAVYKEKVPNKEYVEKLITTENENEEEKVGEDKYGDVDIYIAYKTGERYTDVKFVQSNFLGFVVNRVMAST